MQYSIYISGIEKSGYVNAELQFSVLIFSFTYLLFILFGHIRPQKPIVNLLLVFAILFANTFSLVFTRDHYKLFYQNPYKALLIDYQEAGQTDNRTVSILDSHHRNSAYYSTRLGIDTTGFRWFDSFKDEHEFKCFLENQSMDHPRLYLGSLSSINPLSVPLIQEYYPALVWRKDYAGATSYMFSQEQEQERNVIGKLDFESARSEPWSSLDPGKYTDTASFMGIMAYLIDRDTEFGPTFSMKLEEIDWKENDFMEISVRVNGSIRSDQFLVASLESKGESIYWGGTPFDSFAPCSDSGDHWITVHHVLKLSDMNLKHPQLQLKAYIWNRGGASFLVDDFQISLRQGNPLIYGLNEKFRK